jgi:hypothetical protein
MPIMVLVDVDDQTEDQHIVTVAAADAHDGIVLARDRDAHVLVYDETMKRRTDDDPATAAAITLADSREWPSDTQWEHGPDPFSDPYGCVKPGWPHRDGVIRRRLCVRGRLARPARCAVRVDRDRER